MKTTRHSWFPYTPSYQTDVKKTFERVRRRQNKELDKATPAPLAPVSIASLTRKKAGGRP